MKTLLIWCVICLVFASIIMTLSHLGYLVFHDSKPPEEVRLDNIERVLMHQPGHFTFLVRGEEGLEPFTIGNCYGAGRFMTDVPAGRPMWATWMKGTGCSSDSLTIHLHDASEINGAGWNNGKFGSGQTQVIE